MITTSTILPCLWSLQLYHAPKLHPGPCSSVGVWPQTDRQTHRRAWPQYILRRLRLTQNVSSARRTTACRSSAGPRAYTAVMPRTMTIPSQTNYKRQTGLFWIRYLSIASNDNNDIRLCSFHWLGWERIITFCVSRRRRKMYCGHARLCVCVCVSVCLCVCLSAAVRTHYCTDPDVTWRHGRGRGCPLGVHYWADLQSRHGVRCYGNVTRTLVTSLRPSRDMTT